MHVIYQAYTVYTICNDNLGLLVGIVHSQNKAMEFVFVFIVMLMELQ
jgi:hypothetical protein